jgi:hypothetical protein
MEMKHMPSETQIENPPAPLTDEAAAFVGRIEANVSDQPRRFVVTDRFTAEQGTLYQGYAIVRTPNYDIPSKMGYGPSTAVELARLDDGRRVTLWVSNQYEQEHLKRLIDTAAEDGKAFPLEIATRRLARTETSTTNSQLNLSTAEIPLKFLPYLMTNGAK